MTFHIFFFKSFLKQMPWGSALCYKIFFSPLYKPCLHSQLFDSGLHWEFTENLEISVFVEPALGISVAAQVVPSLCMCPSRVPSICQCRQHNLHSAQGWGCATAVNWISREAMLISINYSLYEVQGNAHVLLFFQHLLCNNVISTKGN